MWSPTVFGHENVASCPIRGTGAYGIGFALDRVFRIEALSIDRTPGLASGIFAEVKPTRYMPHESATARRTGGGGTFLFGSPPGRRSGAIESFGTMLRGFNHRCRNSLNGIKMSLYLTSGNGWSRCPFWVELERTYQEIERCLIGSR